MESRFFLFLLNLFLVACTNTNTNNITVDSDTFRVKLTDASREKLINALEGIIESNSKRGDTTINGKFIGQEKSDNGEFYITIKTGDSTITVNNLLPINERDIFKMKKKAHNITLTFNPTDSIVKFLAIAYEQEK